MTTATSTVTTRELIGRINRRLRNHGERLVQQPDGKWSVVSEPPASLPAGTTYGHSRMA